MTMTRTYDRDFGLPLVQVRPAHLVILPLPCN